MYFGYKTLQLSGSRVSIVTRHLFKIWKPCIGSKAERSIQSEKLIVRQHTLEIRIDCWKALDIKKSKMIMKVTTKSESLVQMVLHRIRVIHRCEEQQ
jgi:hypothetical protein